MKEDINIGSSLEDTHKNFKERLDPRWNLKPGDLISQRYGEDPEEEIIETIIYNNHEGDFRASWDRVTINGLHWYVEDIKIIKNK